MINDFGQKKQQPISILLKTQTLHRTPKPSDESIANAQESWTLADKNTYVVNGSTVKQLPSGAYTIQYNHTVERYSFKMLDIKIDELVSPASGIIKKTLDEIEEFWGKEDLYKKLGFLHYRGYLFYGPQGSGKTCLVQLIVKDIVMRGGLVFLCQDSYAFTEGIKGFRSVEPTRKIVCLFEDIDTLAKGDDEAGLLSFLDGELKVEGVLNIATTNYPELLDKRIVNRPRRFDRVIKIEYPDSHTRKAYFEKKLDKRELDKWVTASEGLSFAGLAELVIRVKCLNHSFNDTLNQLLEMQKMSISSNTSEGKDVGFN